MRGLKNNSGLSWQVVSTEVPALMSDPDPGRAQHATRAVMTTRKIDFAATRAAADAGRRRRAEAPPAARPRGARHDGPVSDVAIVTLPDAGVLDALAPDVPNGLELRSWDVTAPPRDVLGDDAARVRAVVMPYSPRPTGLRWLADLPALELVQVLTAGVDGVVGELPDGVPLANGAGVHDASTAEMAVALALASLRGLDDAVREQDRARWRPSARPGLADRRVLLLGVGGVGGAIASRLLSFEVDLVRVASRARMDALGLVHSLDELPSLLPRAEVVVLALPLTDATRGVVDAGFLAAMPEHALLVNVGRGKLVDTGALVAELRRGRLRAALDVVDPEPLPPEHPLWGLPGVIITPHDGGSAASMHPRTLVLLRTQMRRLAAGQQPMNLVDPA